ncbi:MAG: hypothetical protein KY469_11935 [Actinobacteria bacterium]|nr:hypothetical protein [Actinomycetota bacterium]
MRRSTTALMATGLVGALFIAAPGLAGPGNGGNDPQGAKSPEKDTVPADCPEGGTVELNGDLLLWPPNHKYSDYTVTATDDDGDDVMLGTSAYHDEYVEAFMPAPPTEEPSQQPEPGEEEVGAGNTTDDSRPVLDFDSGDPAVTTHELRSERSGRGDGRTYTIEFNADSGDWSCDGEFLIEVPHDMRSDKAPPKEDKTDSTGPNQDD